ncbi:uncharacterized protein LOC142591669 isoform X1 [Dermacentor variabilis]|uniref:uncharacterized protein LOC142591669 isoform X1 n=1 Tax=Dermacentor variabilis TaxID=34621 RepID=UPI003F5CA0A0
MKSFLVAVFFAIICLQLHDCEALVSETARASGTTNKCLTITLPNFLGIGACTKSYSNLCTPGSVGITGLVQRILECFVNGMLNFDLPTQIYLFIEFLKELFQETDPIPEILGGFCETLSSFTGVIGIDLDCNLLQLDTQALCEDKIQLTVPATLNLTECFGQVPFTCIKGKVLTEPLLKGFTVLVACLTRTVINLGLDGSLEELVCYIAELPFILFGKQTSELGSLTDGLVLALQQSFAIHCSVSNQRK